MAQTDRRTPDRCIITLTARRGKRNDYISSVHGTTKFIGCEEYFIHVCVFYSVSHPLVLKKLWTDSTDTVQGVRLGAANNIDYIFADDPLKSWVLSNPLSKLSHVAYPQRAGGSVPPDFRPEGTVMQKPYPLFDTQ